MTMKHSARWFREHPVALYAVTVALFVLGWGKYLAPVAWVYSLDYAFRVAVCGVVFFGGGMAGAFVRPPALLRTAGAGVAALAAVIICDAIYFGLMRYAGWFPLAGFPPLDNVYLKAFDLTFGIALVALSAELVFRHVAARAMDRPGASWVLRDLLPAAVFGLIHLPQGAALVVTALLIGLVLMRLYRATGSLWPPILVHMAFDLLVFSGAGCPARPGICVLLP